MKNVHILLVEDNDGDIFLTKEAFEESKVEVKLSVAKNGEDALDFVFKRNKFKKTEKVDIILLDINIPKINGHEVLKTIKESDKFKQIPIIILSTSTHKEDIEKAYSNYVNGYVSKPMRMEEFIDAILKIEKFWLQLCTYPD